MAELDRGDHAGTGRATGVRWFRVEVLDGAQRELAEALAGTGCLVLPESDGLCVAVPGVPSLEAETSLRCFLGSWRSGRSAALRP